MPTESLVDQKRTRVISALSEALERSCLALDIPIPETVSEKHDSDWHGWLRVEQLAVVANLISNRLEQSTEEAA